MRLNIGRVIVVVGMSFVCTWWAICVRCVFRTLIGSPGFFGRYSAAVEVTRL